MPVVKNMMPFEAGAPVGQALPPIIGWACRPVFRAARCFEYWNLELLWSLDVGVWNFLSPPPSPVLEIKASQPGIKPNQG
jgi:hypothetical protein